MVRIGRPNDDLGLTEGGMQPRTHTSTHTPPAGHDRSAAYTSTAYCQGVGRARRAQGVPPSCTHHTPRLQGLSCNRQNLGITAGVTQARSWRPLTATHPHPPPLHKAYVHTSIRNTAISHMHDVTHLCVRRQDFVLSTGVLVRCDHCQHLHMVVPGAQGAVHGHGCRCSQVSSHAASTAPLVTGKIGDGRKRAVRNKCTRKQEICCDT